MTIALSVLLGLLAMVFYGFANAFSKPLTQKFGAAQVIFLRGLIIVGLIAACSIPDYSNLENWQAVLATFTLGVAGYVPVLAFMHAIKSSPLGVVAPIAGTAPLVTLILAFLFLQVGLSPLQWLAVIIVVLANVVISLNVRNWRQSRFLQVSSGIPFALVASLGWGLFYFFLVPATEALGPWIAALIVEVGVTVAAGLHIWISKMPVPYQSLGVRTMWWTSALIAAATVAFTIGVNHFNVGIVAALSNSTALVTTLIGVYFFREKLRTKERIVAAITIVCIASLPLL